MLNINTCKCKLPIEGYEIGDIVPFKIMYGNRYSFLIPHKDPNNKNNWDGWSNSNETFLKYFDLIFEPVKNEDLSYLIPFLKENNIV